MEMNVGYRSVKNLNPHPKNPNKHSKEQVQRLADLIKYQGWRYPIIVSNQSGFIVSGHGRLAAAKLLKQEAVPVMFQDFENDDQEMAFLVSDNAIASWAELDLAAINAFVPELGPEFNIEMLGLKDFMVEPAEKVAPQCGEDEVPEVKESFVKPGDIWQLGRHRLMCGDSTSIDAVEKLMDGEKADMVFTDPPYGISVVKPDGNIGGNSVGKVGYGEKGQYDKKAKCGSYRPIIGDDEPFDPSFLLTLAPQTIIWGANNFASKLPDNSHWIVWNKEMPEGTDFSGAELAWTSIDKKAVKTYKFTWAGMTRQGNRKDEMAERVHPTQKPVGLFETILNDYNPASVIDLYGGSGSTLIACEKTTRRCFMMELDPHYCAVIVERWQKYTGKRAERILDGTS